MKFLLLALLIVSPSVLNAYSRSRTRTSSCPSSTYQTTCSTCRINCNCASEEECQNSMIYIGIFFGVVVLLLIFGKKRRTQAMNAQTTKASTTPTFEMNSYNTNTGFGQTNAYQNTSPENGYNGNNMYPAYNTTTNQ
mmetsp:Transcript_34884/g.31403  ORF Transcript_34884/g.31403 Transcript_34884/m.31403 type:complete len:137 (+) Transcript_34884:47-457(+)